MFGYNSLKINDRGNLEISGCDCVELVEKYGTPLYVMDEAEIRRRCREIRKKHIDKYNGIALYASKAFLNKEMCRIVKSEGLGLDVVSSGELYTAYSVDFPMDKIVFHGNNKTIDELQMAVELSVGRIVLDNFYEINMLESLLKGKGKRIDVQIRVAPGIEGHTHDYIKTGQIDTKFGFSLQDGSARSAIDKVIHSNCFNFKGLHSHLGSQLFENEIYISAVKILVEEYRRIKELYGIELDEINVGGGFAIYYSKEDERRNISFYSDIINKTVDKEFSGYGLKRPTVYIEPGRWVVGEAGITLYTVGAIKEIKGIRKYVCIDGGMTDNIRPSLYNANYTAVVANKKESEEKEVITIAGKCCESGDILIKDCQLNKLESGDILAVLSTGAYNFTMSSNYNRMRRPAVVMANKGKDRIIVKRQTFEDLIKNDI
ncbi:diaminopimelate decarboxylase [Fervidicella metallireducens AeB]|uniref:Diaminopimelate decarboxylase n=1 Tax=Fervidicella metallireducens AeB TaxID=1403537 RepID=A0A017RVG0_9CLOT|nr:diaminopimelate decarboxylase [Fervidicella metallireducens]EYE88551.1 diaminopimelate decarboxylase [Fervidicella metallireducens AeB]